MSLSERDIKLLWGKAASRCAICRVEVSQHKTSGGSVLIGEQAHIIGAERSAARGISQLSSDERDSYFNRILLCPTHHTEVDKNATEYPAERLYIIKAQHEAWVQVALEAAQTKPASQKSFAELLGFIEGIKPLLKWLYSGVPAQNAPQYFQALQIFWASHNIATEHLNGNLTSGIECLLRPLGAQGNWSTTPSSYTKEKLKQAEHGLHSYFRDRGFRWLKVNLDAEPSALINELGLNIEGPLEDNTGLESAELAALKHALYITKHSQRCFGANAHISIPEEFGAQFLVIIDAYLAQIGYRIPQNPIEADDVDFIKALAADK